MVGASFQPTVDSFVLFQFKGCAIAKTVSDCFSVLFQCFISGCADALNKTKKIILVDHRQHSLTAHPWNKTLKQF